MGFSADRSLFSLRPRHFQEGVLHADNAREKKVAEEVSGEMEHVTMRMEMLSLFQKPPLNPVASV